MGMPLSGGIKTLLDGPNYAHLATLMPDGAPQVVPSPSRLPGWRVQRLQRRTRLRSIT